MKLLIRILVTSALVLLIANLMPGVSVAGFDSTNCYGGSWILNILSNLF
jgi:uncharacterized membrane protein YvlD (DUF360 family)